MVADVEIDEVGRWFGAVFAAAPADALIEMRFRRATGMGQSFHRRQTS
jgi:hypothetical protein